MNKNLLSLLPFLLSVTGIVNAQWTQQTSNTMVNLAGIHCTDASHCFTAGNNGTFRKTVNGGAAWTVSGSGSTFTNISCLKMYDTSIVWTGKVNGTFHRTLNGGTAWGQVVGNTTHVIYDIFYHNATNYIAVGGSPTNLITGGQVIDTSNNAGTSWSAQNISGLPTMFGIHCMNLTTCIACAGAEAIYKSYDGGATWTSKHSGTTVILYDVDFPSSSIGYAVGGDPALSSSVALKTTDGGETWNALSLQTPNIVYGTHFTSVDTGYVVGKGGFIFKTMDGGANWGSQVSPVSTDLNKIFFADDNTGYISGASGVILKTTNAGGIVTEINETISENLFSVLGNPSHNEMKIETKFEMQNAELLIFNSLGQKMETRKNISGNSISVNTSDFASGIYFFRINNSGKNISGKFVVE